MTRTDFYFLVVPLLGKNFSRTCMVGVQDKDNVKVSACLPNGTPCNTVALGGTICCCDSENCNDQAFYDGCVEGELMIFIIILL